MLNTEKLKKISKLSLHSLAKLTGLNYVSLSSKLRRNSELRVNEAQVIEKVLRDYYNIKVIDIKHGQEVKDE
jgi:hypothetical protein